MEESGAWCWYHVVNLNFKAHPVDNGLVIEKTKIEYKQGECNRRHDILILLDDILDIGMEVFNSPINEINTRRMLAVRHFNV